MTSLRETVGALAVAALRKRTQRRWTTGAVRSVTVPRDRLGPRCECATKGKAERSRACITEETAPSDSDGSAGDDDLREAVRIEVIDSHVTLLVRIGGEESSDPDTETTSVQVGACWLVVHSRTSSRSEPEIARCRTRRLASKASR